MVNFTLAKGLSFDGAGWGITRLHSHAWRMNGKYWELFTGAAGVPHDSSKLAGGDPTLITERTLPEYQLVNTSSSNPQGQNYIQLVTPSQVSHFPAGTLIDVGFDCGNISVAVSTATQTSGIATLTFSSAPPIPFYVGEQVTIAGVSISNYNLSNVILTGATSMTISYAVSGSPGSGTGGVATQECNEIAPTQQQINQVVSTDAINGYVYLEDSLDQPFNYMNTTNGPGYGVPVAVSNADANTHGGTGFIAAQNTTFENFSVDGGAFFMTLDQNWNVIMRNVESNLAGSGDYGTNSHVTIDHSLLYSYITNNAEDWFGAQGGSSYLTITDNRIYQRGDGGQLCDQGSGEVDIERNEWHVNTPSGGGDIAAYGPLDYAYCFNIKISHNRLFISNTNLMSVSQNGNTYMHTRTVTDNVVIVDNSSSLGYFWGSGVDQWSDNHIVDLTQVSNPGSAINGSYAVLNPIATAYVAPLRSITVTPSGGSLSLVGLAIGGYTNIIDVPLAADVSSWPNSMQWESGGAAGNALIIFRFTQDATGGHTVSGWPTTIDGTNGYVRYLNGTNSAGSSVPINPAANSVTSIAFLTTRGPYPSQPPDSTSVEMDELSDSYNPGVLSAPPSNTFWTTAAAEGNFSLHAFTLTGSTAVELASSSWPGGEVTLSCVNNTVDVVAVAHVVLAVNTANRPQFVAQQSSNTGTYFSNQSTDSYIDLYWDSGNSQWSIANNLSGVSGNWTCNASYQPA